MTREIRPRITFIDAMGISFAPGIVIQFRLAEASLDFAHVEMQSSY